jgi:hypothetical protein
MGRTLPAKFLENVGNGPEMDRDAVSGQFTNARGKKSVISRLAREILEQPEHVEMLKMQARGGVGTAPDQLPASTHKLLVEYGYGQPTKNSGDDDEERMKFAALREAARELLHTNPDQARFIDISVQRASANLVLAGKKKEDDGDPAA